MADHPRPSPANAFYDGKANWRTGKIARQHPDNPVGQFCYWHFSRIAAVPRTQKPLYAL
ncbi:hypothetical protein ACNKHW_21255 [Shigella flexneri]